jgi:hypothetical protein
MKNTAKTFFLFSLIAILGLGLTTSCRKKKDTIALITVKDSENAVVEGAIVEMRAESSETGTGKDINEDLNFEATTNSSGTVEFNFNEYYKLGQAGVVVMNVYASKGSLSGETLIKIEEEKVNEETIFILN